MRFAIRRNIQGTMALVGSYPVSTDEAACAACQDDTEALDLYAQDEGHKDFKALCAATGLSRDDFKAEKVEG